MQTIVTAILPAFMVLMSAAGAKALSVGNEAPDFTLPSTEDNITLSSYRGKKAVVLAFYFKDFTSG